LKRLLAALAVLALAGLARGEDTAPPKGYEPVPPALLKGRALVFEAGNCSVEAPPGFEWVASAGLAAAHPEVHMFLCHDAEQVYTLQVYDQGVAKLDAASMAEFLNGAKGSMEQQAYTFLDTRSNEAAVPIPGSSFRFVARMRHQAGSAPEAKAGSEVNWIGYATCAGKMYVLSVMQAEAADRPEFNQLVRSFKLLHEPPPPPGRGSLGAYVIMGLVVSSLVAAIGRRQQRRAEVREKDAILASRGAEDAVGDGDDEDDDTDAFTPRPIAKKGAPSPPKRARPREEERPRERAKKPEARPAPAKEPTRGGREGAEPPPRGPDRDSRRKKRAEDREGRDEKADRPRKNDRPFG
jgi:hypothetical protein